MLPGMDLSRMTLDEVQAPAAASGGREWEELELLMQERREAEREGKLP
jgi:hypothetical protein